MIKTKETIEILKARWPEVILLVGFNILFLLSTDFKVKFSSSMGASVVYFVFFILLGGCGEILRLGFLRTVCLEEDKPQEPMFLLKVGAKFFLRIFVLGLIYAPIMFALAWFFFTIISQFVSVDSGFMSAAKESPLLFQACFSAAMLVLMKPLLLIPAIVIVADCKIVKSFRFLSCLKLLEQKSLVAVFFVSIILNFAASSLQHPDSFKEVFSYLVIIFIAVTSFLVWLLVSVTAVRFVKSVDLAYDFDEELSGQEEFFED